jgi:DNA-binding MarR family transcriptional regulator
MTETTGAGAQAAPASRQILPLVNHLARVGGRAVDARTSGCLRPRHMVALRLLSEHGPMTQHAFGTALSLDPSNVVGLLNELEERGLVTRRRDPADRRRHIVELSAVGWGEVARTCDMLDLVEGELLKPLTAEERAVLYDLLRRVVNDLGRQPCEPAGCGGAKEMPEAEVVHGTMETPGR